MSKVTGKVSQIVGPVIDVEFSADAELPKIYDSLEINCEDGSILVLDCLLYTSPSPRDRQKSRMPSSA